MRGQRRDCRLHPGSETRRGVGRQPEVLAQPPGMREVVQGDERLHPPLPASVENRRVARQRPVIDLAGRRFDPRPLHTESKAVAAEGGGAIEVLLVARPEVDGHARRLHAPGPLPPHPVVGGLAGAVEAPFDLESRRGDAETKSFGEDGPRRGRRRNGARRPRPRAGGPPGAWRRLSWQPPSWWSPSWWSPSWWPPSWREQPAWWWRPVSRRMRRASSCAPRQRARSGCRRGRRRTRVSAWHGVSGPSEPVSAHRVHAPRTNSGRVDAAIVCEHASRAHGETSAFPREGARRRRGHPD